MQKWDMQNKMWLCGLWTDTKRLILLKNIRITPNQGNLHTFISAKMTKSISIARSIQNKEILENSDFFPKIEIFEMQIFSEFWNFWKFRMFFQELKFLKIQNFFGSSGQVQSRPEGLSSLYYFVYCFELSVYVKNESKHGSYCIFQFFSQYFCHMISHMTHHMTCCIGHL